MSADADQLATTPAAERPRLKADNLAGFAAVHIVAALAFVPWFFSWTGVAVFVAGVYVFGVLGRHEVYAYGSRPLFACFRQEDDVAVEGDVQPLQLEQNHEARDDMWLVVQ